MVTTLASWMGGFAGPAGCHWNDRPFECGVPFEGDDDVVRHCAGSHEICVCATNACAVVDDTCKENGGSGYRYLAEPFGIMVDNAEETCVDPADIGWIIEEGKKDECSSTKPDGGSGGGQ